MTRTVRQIGMRSRTALAFAGAVALATGCGTASAHTATTAAIRGAGLSGYSCHAHVVGSAGSVTPSRVIEFRLCPMQVPMQERQTVTVKRSSSDFGPLLRGLSAPDEKATTGPCPMYADVPQRVIARTATGAVLVHIPVDSCGHYQRPAALALSNARSEG